MLLPRGRRRADRFLLPRAALLFLGAGVWFAGVLTGRDDVTAVALGLLCVGVLLSAVGRRASEREPDDDADAGAGDGGAAPHSPQSRQ